MNPRYLQHSAPRSGLAGRLIWLVLGLAALALALFGFVVPIFPGLPFAILAGLCFANVSTRFHARLARVPAMQGSMHQWQRARHAGLREQLMTALALVSLGAVETVRLLAGAVARVVRSVKGGFGTSAPSATR